MIKLFCGTKISIIYLTTKFYLLFLLGTAPCFSFGLFGNLNDVLLILTLVVFAIVSI
jgi:hypothetical protein